MDATQLSKMVLNAELWTICKKYTSNPPVAEQAMIDEIIELIYGLTAKSIQDKYND